MPQEQKYGPHFFGKATFVSDCAIAECACGASEGAVSGCGPTLSPAPDPLPDPSQCRLNPLS